MANVADNPTTVKPTTVDEYMQGLSPEVREVLAQVREVIAKVVPEGVECISYAIPAIKLNGKLLIHFSGWKEHISLYPIPPASDALTKKLQPYVAGKGTLKFPVDEPIPLALITQITKAHLKRLTS